MTEFDDLPFTYEDGEAIPVVLEVEPKPCRRHDWIISVIDGNGEVINPANVGPLPHLPAYVCRRCRRVRDHAQYRRGKSARRLGYRQELRIEKVYGPRKVGEYGEPVDHVGRDWKWQSKATRNARPAWLVRITAETAMPTLPTAITTLLVAMDAYYPALAPVVIRSYVRAGVKPDDYLFVRAADWNGGEGYVVVPGVAWLDIRGRDEA